MATTRFRIDGLRELERALQELPKATGKNVLRRVLKKRGEPLARDMAARAPDDPETGGNDLKSSIAYSTRLSKRQAAKHRKMFKSDKAAVEGFVGPGPLPQAHLQEFGSAIHGPQPYARPAWDAGQRPMLDGIASDLGSEIEKARARIARKTARLAR